MLANEFTVLGPAVRSIDLEDGISFVYLAFRLPLTTEPFGTLWACIACAYLSMNSLELPRGRVLEKA